MHDDDETLIAEILPALDIDHQYVRLVEGWDQELVDQIRRCGRAAGRRLNYRVRTFVTDRAEREDDRRVVCVAVVSSTAAEEARLSERSELLIRELFKDPRG